MIGLLHGSLPLLIPAWVMCAAVSSLSAAVGGGGEEPGGALDARPAPPVASAPAFPVAAPPVFGPPAVAIPFGGDVAAPITDFVPVGMPAMGGSFARPAMAKINADGKLTVQRSVMKPVTETRKVKDEEIGPDGEKVVVERAVVQVRFIAETHDAPVPHEFDVFKIDGARLSEEEARKAMKEERAVVIASDAMRLAEILSPLGRKLYRDDVLVISLRPAPARLEPIAPAPLPAAAPFVPDTPLVVPGTDPIEDLPLETDPVELPAR